jgi:hypothetical protein
MGRFPLDFNQNLTDAAEVPAHFSIPPGTQSFYYPPTFFEFCNPRSRCYPGQHGTAYFSVQETGGIIMALPLEVNTDVTGVVIRGYDPVAYFTEGRPLPGGPDLSVEYGGGKYLFATAENRDAFKSAPETYAPQYGGYCAFGVSMGKKFDIDPSSWRIVNKRLYFNLNPAILKKWSADAKDYIQKAEKNWPQIREKAAADL